LGVGILPINILKEPRNKKYQNLIQYAFEVSKTFVVSMQSEILACYPKPAILKSLDPYKINELKARCYPQIEYYSQDSMLYFYECNEDTKRVIMQAVDGLYEWRYPALPEDLTFLNDKGDVWMYSISHECMSGINENDRNEVNLIKDDIGLEIYWRENIYTEDEISDAMDSLFGLIKEYFYLLGSCTEEELYKEASVKENSQCYGFWNDFFREYDISEHCLAFEIARFSNLLRLNEPIYAIEFSSLLDEKVDNSYLVESLVKNINGNLKIFYGFIDNFKSNYIRKR
jgi:hypothetical protein